MKLVHPVAQFFNDRPIRTLLVDLDGTLLGNQIFPLSIKFIRDSLRTLKKTEAGIAESIRLLVALQKELKIPSSTDLTNEQRVVELISKRMKVSTEVAKERLESTVRSIFPNLKSHFYPMDGAREFLSWAYPRYPLHLATHPIWPEDIVRLRLEWAGISPTLFRSITHIKIMHSVKPHPAYYREILAQNSLDANDCILIGDDLKMDLPATEVGIRVFIVGKKNRLSLLKHKKAKAPAARGTYEHLRMILET